MRKERRKKHYLDLLERRKAKFGPSVTDKYYKGKTQWATIGDDSLREALLARAGTDQVTGSAIPGDWSKSLSAKSSTPTETLSCAKEQFHNLFDPGSNNGYTKDDERFISYGVLSGYRKGIILGARHSTSAGKDQMQLQALVIDAWAYFFEKFLKSGCAQYTGKCLAGFRVTVQLYRPDYPNIKDDKGFMFHLQNCWEVAIAMNPQRKGEQYNTGEKVRMHEFAYAFLLAYGYAGKITNGDEMRGADYLDLVNWESKMGDPAPPDTRYFKGWVPTATSVWTLGRTSGYDASVTRNTGAQTLAKNRATHGRSKKRYHKTRPWKWGSKYEVAPIWSDSVNAGKNQVFLAGGWDYVPSPKGKFTMGEGNYVNVVGKWTPKYFLESRRPDEYKRVTGKPSLTQFYNKQTTYTTRMIAPSEGQTGPRKYGWSRVKAPPWNQQYFTKKDDAKALYFKDLDIMEHVREELGRERRIIPLDYAAAENERWATKYGQDGYLELQYIPYGSVTRITKRMFTDFFMRQAMDFFFNVHDKKTEQWDNENDMTQQNPYLLTQEDTKLNKSQLTDAAEAERIIQMTNFENMQERLHLSAEEAREEMDLYTDFLLKVFKAGETMVPMATMDQSLVEKVSSTSVSGRTEKNMRKEALTDPSFHYAAIVAHEFAFRNIRAGYGRDILMLVPPNLPKSLTNEWVEMADQQMPPALIQDYPHPEADTVRNILEGLVEGYTPKEQFETTKREAMDPIEAWQQSEVNQALHTHFRHMFNNGPKEPAATPAIHLPTTTETKEEGLSNDKRWNRAVKFKLSEEGAVECPAGTAEISTPSGGSDQFPSCEAAAKTILSDGTKDGTGFDYAGQEDSKDFPKGCYVFKSPDLANDKAAQHQVYFNGDEDGVACDTCQRLCRVRRYSIEVSKTRIENLVEGARNGYGQRQRNDGFLTTDLQGDTVFLSPNLAMGDGRTRWILMRGSAGWFNIKVYGRTFEGNVYLSATTEGDLKLVDRDDGSGLARWAIVSAYSKFGLRGGSDPRQYLSSRYGRNFYHIKVFGGLSGDSVGAYLGDEDGEVTLTSGDDGSGMQQWIITEEREDRFFSKGSAAEIESLSDSWLLVANAQCKPNGLLMYEVPVDSKGECKMLCENQLRCDRITYQENDSNGRGKCSLSYQPIRPSRLDCDGDDQKWTYWKPTNEIDSRPKMKFMFDRWKPSDRKDKPPADDEPNQSPKLVEFVQRPLGMDISVKFYPQTNKYRAVVKKVAEGSNAERWGVRKGVEIVGLDGVAIHNYLETHPLAYAPTVQLTQAPKNPGVLELKDNPAGGSATIMTVGFGSELALQGGKPGMVISKVNGRPYSWARLAKAFGMTKAPRSQSRWTNNETFELQKKFAGIFAPDYIASKSVIGGNVKKQKDGSVSTRTPKTSTVRLSLMTGQDPNTNLSKFIMFHENVLPDAKQSCDPQRIEARGQCFDYYMEGREGREPTEWVSTSFDTVTECARVARTKPGCGHLVEWKAMARECRCCTPGSDIIPNSAEMGDQGTDAPSLYTYSCDNYSPNIYGGGWRLVRHAPRGYLWHPATDLLEGKSVYGDPSLGHHSPWAWSKRFDNQMFDEFLFATGDESMWLVARKEQVIGDYYGTASGTVPDNDEDKGEEKATEKEDNRTFMDEDEVLKSEEDQKSKPRQVVMSSSNGGPYDVTWRRESTNPSDPVIALTDYGAAVDMNTELYHGGSYPSAFLLKRFLGANVFIRSDSDVPPFVLAPRRSNKCPKGTIIVSGRDLCAAAAQHFVLSEWKKGGMFSKSTGGIKWDQLPEGGCMRVRDYWAYKPGELDVTTLAGSNGPSTVFLADPSIQEELQIICYVGAGGSSQPLFNDDGSLRSR